MPTTKNIGFGNKPAYFAPPLPRGDTTRKKPDPIRLCHVVGAIPSSSREFDVLKFGIKKKAKLHPARWIVPINAILLQPSDVRGLLIGGPERYIGAGLTVRFRDIYMVDIHA